MPFVKGGVMVPDLFDLIFFSFKEGAGDSLRFSLSLSFLCPILKNLFNSDMEPWPCCLSAAAFGSSSASEPLRWDFLLLPPKILDLLLSSLSESVPLERGNVYVDDPAD